MKKFTYPAVFYFDKNTKTYCAVVEDLELYVDGGTVEEAHKNASEVLHAFASIVLKNDDYMPEASSFDVVVGKYPKNLVMLIECSL